MIITCLMKCSSQFVVVLTNLTHLFLFKVGLNAFKILSIHGRTNKVGLIQVNSLTYNQCDPCELG